MRRRSCLGDFAAAAEAFVRSVRQVLERPFVRRQSRRLDDGFLIEGQFQGRQGGTLLLHESWTHSGAIEILDPQQEPASVDRANSQARTAVRRLPTWSSPVGLGAYRPAPCMGTTFPLRDPPIRAGSVPEAGQKYDEGSGPHDNPQERILNLTICLLVSGRYLPKSRIREAVEGYHDLSDAAFERTFERDKDELRSLGVPIEVGSFDPLFDDEPGYRILPSEFELPPIDLDAEEAAVVGVAARVGSTPAWPSRRRAR